MCIYSTVHERPTVLEDKLSQARRQTETLESAMEDKVPDYSTLEFVPAGLLHGTCARQTHKHLDVRFDHTTPDVDSSFP